MTNTTRAKKALLLALFEGFPASYSQITEATLAAYAAGLEAYPIEAVRLACERFARGEVPEHGNRFAPSLAELAVQVRLFAEVLEQVRGPRGDGLIVVPIGQPIPEGYVALGPTEVDFGHGRIDMRAMTPAEKEKVLADKGLPPPDRKQLPAAKLQRMD